MPRTPYTKVARGTGPRGSILPGEQKDTAAGKGGRGSFILIPSPVVYSTGVSSRLSGAHYHEAHLVGRRMDARCKLTPLRRQEWVEMGELFGLVLGLQGGVPIFHQECIMMDGDLLCTQIGVRQRALAVGPGIPANSIRTRIEGGMLYR